MPANDYYINQGPGWQPFILALVNDLDALLGEENWYVEQVKEKFGTLRFYWQQTGGDVPYAQPDALVIAAEALSARTCEVCGKPSEGPQSSKSGWLYTLCDEHREENARTGDPAWKMADLMIRRELANNLTAEGVEITMKDWGKKGLTTYEKWQRARGMSEGVFT